MFKMTVAGTDTFEVSSASIISVGFKTDIPMDSDARTADVGTTITVRGRILTELDGDPFDSTRKMALWSTVPSSNMECYRCVTVQNIRGGVVERTYVMPNSSNGIENGGNGEDGDSAMRKIII